jgi:hypothetical protein
MDSEGDRTKVIAKFRKWVASQPELLWLIRAHLPGKSIGCFCAPKPCHGDILSEIAQGLWDGSIIEEPIFVFGSNLAGRHGRGAALSAAKEYGAVSGVGEGRSGHAYAIPTKDKGLNTRPLEAVLESLSAFHEEARSNPNRQYRLTKVGCGLAGLPEDVIRDFALAHSPENVLLPGQWESLRHPDLLRLIVAGSRDFQDYDFLKRRLDHLLSRKKDVEIVSGGAKGADALGERYAMERGLKLRRIPAFWHLFNKAAGHIRNRRMAWYGTHLAAFWDGKSPGTKGMIQIARDEGLTARTIMTTNKTHS